MTEDTPTKCITCNSATRHKMFCDKAYVICNNPNRLLPRDYNEPDIIDQRGVLAPWTRSFQDMSCWTGKNQIQCAHPDCKYMDYPDQHTEITIDGTDVLFCGICAQEVASWRTNI